MKTSTHKANKIMLGMSLILFISAGLILGVKAFSIDTSVLNTVQVIKRIIISNTNSTASNDILIDINTDSNGTVYIKNKLGIGDSTPSSALQVSGNIIANQFCDTDGTTCSTIANMIGGSGFTFTETDPIYNTGTNGKLCMQVNDKIVCETDTSSGSVDTDTHLTTGEVITMVANSGYLTTYTETDPIFITHSGDYYTTGEADLKFLTSISFKEAVWNTGTSNVIYYNSGNVGIGTGTPSEALTVSGNILANAFLYPSDLRLKTNIIELTPALDNIRKITPYSFDRKSNGRSSIGFIAQELEKIYPILVHTNDDGIKSVNYVNMVVPLTQAIKELDEENQKLKAEIAEIKAMLNKLVK